MKDVCTEDHNLRLKAQAIFGEDLVTKAFVCTWASERCSEGEINKRLGKEAHINSDLEGGCLEYDTQTIRLQFNTGRVVEFRNSEWASMWHIAEST